MTYLPFEHVTGRSFNLTVPNLPQWILSRRLRSLASLMFLRGADGRARVDPRLSRVNAGGVQFWRERSLYLLQSADGGRSYAVTVLSHCTDLN